MIGPEGGIMAQATGYSTRVSILMALRDDPGDQSAWSAFVDRYGPQIHAWCLRWRLQDADAQDVTQNVLLKLVRHLPDFAYDPSRSFRGWLRTLTAHSWSDFIRDQVRGVRGAADSVVADRLDTVQARVDLVRHLEETYDRELLELAMAEVSGAGRVAHLGGVPPDGHRGGRRGGGGGATGHRRGHGLPGAVRGSDEAARGRGRPGFRRGSPEMNVTTCPDLDELHRFLEGPEPGVDDETIVAHVEGCAACRTELERLAAVTEVLALQAVRTARTVCSDLSFLRDLRELDLRHLDDGPAPPSAEAPLPQVPGYEVLGELGRGGAGVVYHARHLMLGRPVAIKMLHPSLFPSDADRRRLRAEAEAVARLQHPNVVQLYEIGEVDGSPFLVLEYVAGGTLAAYLAGRPQPPRDAAALLVALARAVHAAHRERIIHRDLKPANILLHRDPTAARATVGRRTARDPCRCLRPTSPRSRISAWPSGSTGRYRA